MIWEAVKKDAVHCEAYKKGCDEYKRTMSMPGALLETFADIFYLDAVRWREDGHEFGIYAR